MNGHHDLDPTHGASSNTGDVWSHRDADNTRRLLIRAARHRFASEGYRATTVRRIAADAGVSVALINRYFGSKDGLFEACVRETMVGLSRYPTRQRPTFDEAITAMIRRVIESPNADEPLQLLLLLRSSGDERADDIRRAALESFTDSVVALACRGRSPSEGDRLRAQIAIATLLGLVMMRTSTGLEPATSAAEAALGPPLKEALVALLR